MELENYNKDNFVSTSDSDCSYYRNRDHRVKYFINRSQDLPEIEFEALLNQGYRRSGDFYYQNQCPSCFDCLSYRLPLVSFKITDWQKRILKQNADCKLEVVKPRPDLTKENLYLKYQYHQHHLKPMNGFKCEKFNPLSSLNTMYYQMYTNPPGTMELEIKQEHRLLAFAILDVAGKSSSAVYSVYDPSLPKRSLGSLMILKMIEWSMQNNLGYFHLGFFLPGHEKMTYKQRFKPAEILNAANGRWEPAETFLKNFRPYQP